VLHRRLGYVDILQLERVLSYHHLLAPWLDTPAACQCDRYGVPVGRNRQGYPRGTQDPRGHAVDVHGEVIDAEEED
ncbi:MAG: hypothetical protein IH908_14575, partial [Proteobacteria bacterium]|nr:hypothetical protein [Pseudomonadota bacterium]